MVRHYKLVLGTLFTGVGAAILILIAGATQAQVTTWDTPVQISDTEGSSGGPRLVVDRQNTVHLLWSDWIDQVSHPPYLQYTNKVMGGDWTQPIYLPDKFGQYHPGTFGGEPAIVADPDGALHMVWENYRYIDNFNDAVTYIQRDNIGTWSMTEKVPSQEEWPAASQPDIGLGPDGSVHVVYKDWLGPGHQKTIHHVVRLPTGVWTGTHQVTLDEGDYNKPLLAVDDLGSAHLVYTKNYTDHYEFYYAHTNTEGVWSGPVKMTSSPSTWSSVEQLTSGADGKIHLVWGETDTSSFPYQCTVKYSGKVRSGGWSTPVTLGRHCITLVSVAADKYGSPHVAWKYDGKLWYVRINPDGFFTYPAVVEDTDGFHYSDEDLSIAVDALGGRHVAWGSRHDGNIWYTGIEGDIPVTSVITESGGTVFAFSGDTFVEFPAGAVKNDVTITHTPQKGTAPGNMVGVTYFDLSAETVNEGTPVTNFDQIYTITGFYVDGDITGIQESTLGLYWWNNGEWERINSSEVHPVENYVTASLDHMTEFALIGESGETGFYLNLPLIIRESTP